MGNNMQQDDIFDKVVVNWGSILQEFRILLGRIKRDVMLLLLGNKIASFGSKKARRCTAWFV